MVRVQITPYRQTDFSGCVRLLSLCSGQNAQRELSEYLASEAVRVLCARRDGLKGLAVLLMTADCCDILDIAVDSTARRTGVARALMAHAEDICRQAGIRAMMLEVRLSNTAARALYKSCGFEEISRRENYYSSPRETAAVMKKELSYDEGKMQ